MCIAFPCRVTFRFCRAVCAARSRSEQRLENFPIGKFFEERLARPSAAFRDMRLYASVCRSALRFNVYGEGRVFSPTPLKNV